MTQHDRLRTAAIRLSEFHAHLVVRLHHCRNARTIGPKSAEELSWTSTVAANLHELDDSLEGMLRLYEQGPAFADENWPMIRQALYLLARQLLQVDSILEVYNGRRRKFEVAK